MNEHPGTPVTEEKGRELRGLTEDQLDRVSTTKRLGDTLLTHIDTLGPSREASLARTKVEEAVMWASKAVVA